MSCNNFPSKAYSSAQEKWLGRDHLITPTIRKTFGEVLNGKSILDVGCGNGHYSRDFLKWGASRVVGIDNSRDMIDFCNCSVSDSENRSEIRFELADITNFCINSQFHIATAFFVLQFIHEKEKLKQAVRNIAAHLNDDGILFGLIPNGVQGVRPPSDMGIKLGAEIRRNWEKPFVDGEMVTINFFENGEICGNASIALHSREFYEQCFYEAGFKQIEWISPIFTDHARQILGDSFCEQFLNPPCDIMFKASKKNCA